MSLVVITRTRDNACWKSLADEDDLDLDGLLDDASQGWLVCVTPYEPEVAQDLAA